MFFSSCQRLKMTHMHPDFLRYTWFKVCFDLKTCSASLIGIQFQHHGQRRHIFYRWLSQFQHHGQSSVLFAGYNAVLFSLTVPHVHTVNNPHASPFIPHRRTEACGVFPLNEMKACLDTAAVLTPSELCIFKNKGEKAEGKHRASSVIAVGW